MAKKNKKDKKHNRKKEKFSKKKHKRKDSDSDSDSTSSSSFSDGEWIEKKQHSANTTQRDDWMSETSFVPTFSLRDIRKKQAEKSKLKQNLQEESIKAGLELNPYWKDGGNGLPEKSKESGKPKLVAHTVGDQGVEWLKKALRRAEQQALEENRSLESVAAERYGSLKNLYGMIEEAEKRNRNSRDGWRRRPRSRSRSRDRSSRPSSSQCSSKFMKPSADAANDDYVSSKYSSSHSRSSWRKRKQKEEPEEDVKNTNTSTVTDVEMAVLTNEEMNSLASKILKAEIMGNKTLVEELKTKLENARKARDKVRQSNASEMENVMILTETSARGFTQPVRGRTDSKYEKKRKKYETHADGQRVRYFEDDEKYSLTEMFEKEQMTSAADVNAEFIRLSSKSKGDKDLAVDDLFMEQSTSNKGKKDNNTQKAIDKQKTKEKTLDSCLRCLTNNKMPKHLIISTGSQVYLSLPSFQSLTENHCLITPIYHATCSTLLDEDIWEEILDYCKKLVNLFREEDFDVVFFETAMNFKHYPHMTIHCVPIPYESGNLAPIYFKKAILECEKEWAQNKKLVDISKMNVKRAIPKGLPYFMVNFGLDNGFAHVIEEEKYFPKNFAQEIIGGMLDLDHSIWRKTRADDFETQCKKVNAFKKLWKS